MEQLPQLGPDALKIIYAPTADGRKPGRPNMISIMAKLSDKLDCYSTETVALAQRNTDHLKVKIKRLQWSIAALAVLEIILRWI